MLGKRQERNRRWNCWSSSSGKEEFCGGTFCSSPVPASFFYSSFSYLTSFSTSQSVIQDYLIRSVTFKTDEQQVEKERRVRPDSRSSPLSVTSTLSLLLFLPQFLSSFHHPHQLTTSVVVRVTLHCNIHSDRFQVSKVRFGTSSLPPHFITFLLQSSTAAWLGTYYYASSSSSSALISLP